MMNRIAALIITTILLTQIASYSYGEITPQVEWEEPLQGDPDWKVTGRNSTSNSSNNESVWGESFETYDSNTGGTYSEIVWEAYNLANDTSYNVSFDLYEYDNSTSGLTLLYSVANMTIFNSSYYYFNYSTTNSTADGFWTTSGTSDGCYYVEINLRNASTAALYSSYGFDWAVNEYCGDEYLDIDHSGYVWETPSLVEVWDSGTDVHVQFTSGNLEVGETYQLIWNLSEWWGSNQPAAGNVTWNATSNSSVENSTISGLANGTYFFQATLKKNNLVVAQDWTMIQMGNNTTTGGNNTGGNNTGGNNTGGNNTDGNSTGGNNTGGNNTGGNNTGGNNVTPRLGGMYSNLTNYSLSEEIDLHWSTVYLESYDESGAYTPLYNTTVNVRGVNPVNQAFTTGVLWDNFTTYTAGPNNMSNGTFYVPPFTLSTGCYYASFELFEDENTSAGVNSMLWDSWKGFFFGVNASCSEFGWHNGTDGNNTGGNNTGGNNTDTNNTGGNNTGGMGTNPGNPIMPSNCTRIDWNLTTNVTIDDCLNGTSAFWFEFNNTGGIVWIDPEVAIGYDYEVFSSHLITHITIPSGYGDNVFDLYLRDTNGLWYDSGENIFGGQTYTLNSPVSAMSIRGIEATAMLSPTDPNAFVSGLTFDTNGSVVMTMTPVIGNYTCGVDNEFIQLFVYTNSMTYQLGDVVGVWYAVNCTINGVEYDLDVDLNNNNHQDWEWNETDNYFSNYEELTNLSVGSYCLNATLSDSDGFITFELACFEVIDTTGGNNTGGNNTGGNNTGGNNTGGNNTGGNNTGGNNTGGDNITWNATLGQYCHSIYDDISVELYMYGLNLTEVSIQWEIFDTSTGEVYASDATDSFVPGGIVPVDTDGSLYFLWEFEAGSAWLPVSGGMYTVMINPTDTSLNNLLDSPLYFNVEVGCGNNTSSGQIGWSNYDGPLDEDCIEGPFYLNGTLTDYNNVTGGSTELYYTIYHVDENGVETPTGMSYSTTVTFDSTGSAEVSVLIDPTSYSDGQYYIHVYTYSSGNDVDQNYWFTHGCDNICGYNISLIDGSYQIWSSAFGTIYSTWAGENGSSTSTNDDTPQIFPGDTLGAYFQINCLTHGEDYLANLTITNDTNHVFYSDERTFTQNHWTNLYAYSEQGISTDLLPAGEYCVTFTLYVSPFGSADVVYTVTNCVEVVDLDDWDGCGTNITYVDHEHEVNGNPFVEQGLVFLTTSNVWYNNFVDCLVIGESYTMTTNITFEGSPYSEETENFTVYQFSDITQWSWGRVNLIDQLSWDWQELDAGNYCVETTIHSTDSTYTNLIAMVSTETDCFAVVEVTDNWADDWWDDQTNNTTGSPNNPIMPDTNCTNLSSSLTGLNLTNAFNMSDCENGTGFWFNLTVNGTGVNWYDPVYAVGYDFEILSGPKFASVVVPPGYGDDKYDIYLWDGSEYVLAASDLDALTQYWFTDDGQITTTPGDYDGITMFSIRGLELDAKLDPDDPNAFVTGLTFVQDPNEVSEVVISMNPIRVSDEDDDGIADDDDNCINDANSDQADSDGDGVGDACETAAAGSDDDDKDDISEEDSSNRTLAYAALLAVGLVAVLVMFGRENEK